MKKLLLLLSLLPLLCQGQSIGIISNNSSSGGGACNNLPAIDTLNPLQTFPLNSVEDIYLTGDYFDGTSSVNSSCFTQINSTIFISSDSILVNVNTANSPQICEVEITNECGSVSSSANLQLQAFSCQTVQFSEFGSTGNYNINVSGNATKITTAGWGGAHGITNNSVFIQNAGEYIEFEYLTTAFVLGLSYNPNPTTSWDTEDFSFYFPNGTTYTRSQNQWQTHTPSWTNGSIMRIEINASGFVEFYQDGNLLRTSNVTVTGPLYPFGQSGVNGGSFINYTLCK